MRFHIASAASLVVACLIALGSGLGGVHALDNGLGRTPQMGYNTWYDAMCSPTMNETHVMRSADALIDLGLFSLGYRYVNLDDCWSGGRDPHTGVQYSQTDTFPSGIAALAEYVHSRGLLFGLYTDRGNATCAGRPGAQNFEKLDASSYADWGVDYVKEDSCYATQDHSAAFAEYALMRDALNSTGRPIFFSLCGWYPWYAPVGASLGNSWRTGQDDTNWAGVLADIDTMNEYNLSQYAAPGGINDPCMLLSVDWEGKPAVTEAQTRAQFNQWAIMASPLIISGSVVNMSPATLETYSNSEVIAVDQDPAVMQGWMLKGVPEGVPLAQGAAQVWGRPLSTGAYAIHFLNAGSQSVQLACDEACFRALLPSLSPSDPVIPSGMVVVVRCLWKHVEVAALSTPLLEVELDPEGGSKLFMLTWLKIEDAKVAELELDEAIVAREPRVDTQ